MQYDLHKLKCKFVSIVKTNAKNGRGLGGEKAMPLSLRFRLKKNSVTDLVKIWIFFTTNLFSRVHVTKKALSSGTGNGLIYQLKYLKILGLVNVTLTLG